MYIKDDMDNALLVIGYMVTKTEIVSDKFAVGSSQHSLLKNRLKALKILSALITQELTELYCLDWYTTEELEKALTPISSLISKIEKSYSKTKKGTWQEKMLSDNLKALNLALPLLTKAIKEDSKSCR